MKEPTWPACHVTLPACVYINSAFTTKNSMLQATELQDITLRILFENRRVAAFSVLSFLTSWLSTVVFLYPTLCIS